MTIPGPSTRVYNIDDHNNSAKNVSALVVGDPGGIGAIEQALHDLTGPSSTSPVILPPGFAKVDDVTMTFQPNVGESIDCSDIFYVHQEGSRTFAVTFVTGWTFSSESYIAKSTPTTQPMLGSLIQTMFRFTGAPTAT